jgi:hypothetical protein
MVRSRIQSLQPFLCLALAPLVAWSAQTGADGARQLEAAIHREFVLGDLKGAIEGYRGVLALEGTSREVAARALFQIGQCQEKLSNRTAAEDAYRRVSDEYGDQDPAAAARAKLAQWKEALPGPRNLKFDEGTLGQAPPGWYPLTLDKDRDFLAPLQRRGCRSESCVVVQAPPNAPSPYGAVMQSFDAAAYRGRTVRLRAWIRVESESPGDHGQMWLSVSRANHRTFFDNMDDRPVRSSQWTQCEIVGDVARDAQFIEFGFMSFGKGRVWVDDASFEVVGR